MTQDEFERIVVALFHTASLNAGGWGFMVRLSSVLEILHSNLHPEDKQKYVVGFKDGVPTVQRVEEEP